MYRELFSLISFLIGYLQPIRLALITLLAFFFSTFFCYFFIRWFKKITSSPVREFVTEIHKTKDKTPTMGGIPMIFAMVATALLTLPVTLPTIWIPLLTLILFGSIGFWDDWKKITNKKGISDGAKFFAQVGASSLIVALWYFFLNPSTHLIIYAGLSISIPLGIAFLLWAVWVMLCTDNAVNFTDGLDALAGTLLALNFATFSLFAHYLHEPLIASIGAIATGVLGGFLWFNAYPAQLFMGDIGSLGFGAMLAIIALMLKLECLIPITGGIFVIEGISVVIQKWSYKLSGKRIFKMAPLHHHFELIGIPETKITARFILATILLCVTAFILVRPYFYLLAR